MNFIFMKQSQTICFRRSNIERKNLITFVSFIAPPTAVHNNYFSFDDQW